MRKNSITWSEIENIIEDSLINNIPFCFVCDEELACDIVEHIEDEYGIIDECDDLFEADEYYICVLPSDNRNPAQLFCESARGISGEYKMNDVEDMEFYIFTDMTRKDAREKLHGDSYGYYELIDEEEDGCEECCDCCCCEDEWTDEDIEIAKILYEYTHKIIQVAPCEECVFDLVQELALKFREIGEDDIKDTFRDFIESLD